MGKEIGSHSIIIMIMSQIKIIIENIAVIIRLI